MNKIESIHLLILLLRQMQPNFPITSGGLLIQAMEWKAEIADMFRILGIPPHEIEDYVDDYIDRLYMHRIKRILIYLISS